ncbi:MAG: methionyl-tRNA formyltransferase [Candidatus Hydrogenedentes bacterium]|nr:methionyl-tRNA formyltransferase [Candidatus Hydrogenedentota bacterium]
MRIAMTGAGHMAMLMTKAIIESGHELVAVIDNGRTTKGYRRRLNPAVAALFASKWKVNGIARRRGVPIIYIDKMTGEELAPLREVKPDVIVVGGFSVIFKKPIIELPRIGCINCHSSLLPRHRGPNPFQAAILSGDNETGVTFHLIDEGIDTGPIVEQHRIPITQSDTAGTLVRRTSLLAAEKLPMLLNRIESEGLSATVQTTEGACYDKKLDGDGLFIRWDRPAAEIDRMVRACFPFAMARFRHRGSTVLVSRAKSYEKDSGKPPGEIVANRPFVRVATGQGTISIIVGYRTGAPFPWLWPGFIRRPRIGERLE